MSDWTIESAVDHCKNWGVHTEAFRWLVAQAGELAKERARIIELEDLVLKLDGLSVPPCFICGYNGPGYWQPETHRCAGRHNAVMDRARGEG